jgi:hypothetical protein
MKKRLSASFIFFLFLARSSGAFAQVNVELLHQLVAESKSEHSIQEDARTKQAAVDANESVNKSKMTDLKSIYRNVQSRFHTLGLVISAAQVGLEAEPIVDEIVNQQGIIVQQCRQNPVLTVLAIDSESDLADQAHLLINYIYGLILSFGDVNQMKASDRKMLFEYVVTELRRIDGASRGLSRSLINFNNQLRGKSNNPFSGFVNRDKSMVDDIMRNAAALKH